MALGHDPLPVPMQDSSSWPPLPRGFLPSPSPSPSRELSDLSLSLPAGAPQEALPDVTPTTTTSFPSRQPLAPQPSLPAPARPAPRYLPPDPSPASLLPADAVYFVKGLISDAEAFSAQGEPIAAGPSGGRRILVLHIPAPAALS